MRRLALIVMFGLLVLALRPVSSGAQDDEPGAWLHEVATAYSDWGRVDDELRWAPFLCRVPPPVPGRISRAGTELHGRKVYFIYASDRAAYLEVVRDQPRVPPRGLTVVKEAFHPVALTTVPRYGDFEFREPMPAPHRETIGTQHDSLRRGIYRPVRDEEGQLTGAGAPRGLYVLRYVGRNVRESDDGWIYGTLTADGEVTSTGVVEQCAACHREAPHGRLFGLDPTE